MLLRYAAATQGTMSGARIHADMIGRGRGAHRDLGHIGPGRARRAPTGVDPARIKRIPVGARLARDRIAEFVNARLSARLRFPSAPAVRRSTPADRKRVV